ncbi:MAG TPA: folylpolyglutamate synthase/dihydrofolate synthase family protein [Planctomycetota bacterium]|nr:folylpolyglutamate synthase/dihydrofolate synthase family protein [Planctomycetota bacterium]
MTYSEALAFLDGFVNLERSAQTRATRVVITLDRVREIAARLGNPQDRFPTLHVAGTKGKGSTCAFAASILTAAGYKTGLYTSPHLVDVRERIRIGESMIPKADFARILNNCRPVLEAMRHPPRGQRRPTYFEILTHLAFAWFAEQNVDVGIIEVGLGGRLDATNIITPVACGITNISFDHQAILGDTLEQIAREKAGIMKPGVPVVLAPQRPHVLRMLQDCAKLTGAPCETIHEPQLPRNLEVGLRGAFQVENWALAARLAEIYVERSAGKKLSAAALREGSRKVSWPGRLEEIFKRVFLDGAHNDHSLETVLREVRPKPRGSSPLVVLFACAKDKDSKAMLRVLAAEKVSQVIFTHSGNVRGKDPADLASEWQTLSGRSALTFASPMEGIAEARRLAGKTGVVLATGSLYLVGAIKSALR